MAVWEGKKYKLKSSEKFDEYLKALGFNRFIRKIATSASSSVSLIKAEDGTYSFITQATLKTYTISFKLNEDFVETTMDGRKINTVITLDGNTFTQIDKDDKESVIIREFTDTECVLTIKLGNITCVRTYATV